MGSTHIMNKQSSSFVVASIVITLLVLVSSPNGFDTITTTTALAHPHTDLTISYTMDVAQQQQQQHTVITPINQQIALEKTVIPFHAPETGILPWGVVEGNVENHVNGYPAIIQILKDGKPVHFAQTDIKPDGSYEYKFRVLSVSPDGEINRGFSGDYSVKIFKMIDLGSQQQQKSIHEHI